MAISKGSNLKDKDRVFTISVDNYDNTMRGGVLYRGEDDRGIRFDGYLMLLREIEDQLDKMNYPRANMRPRRLQPAETFLKESCLKESCLKEPFPKEPFSREPFPKEPFSREMFPKEPFPKEPFPKEPFPRELFLQDLFSEGRQSDGAGRRGSYSIRITHRSNASWQGSISCIETQEKYQFASFMDFIDYLDAHIRRRTERENTAEQESTTERKRENDGQRFERCLSIMIESAEKRRLKPGVYRCRCGTGSGAQTFIIRLVFHEHDTCQGILYWMERKKQCVFRSFLELVRLISGVMESTHQ